MARGPGHEQQGADVSDVSLCKTTGTHGRGSDDDRRLVNDIRIGQCSCHCLTFLERCPYLHGKVSDEYVSHVHLQALLPPI